MPTTDDINYNIIQRQLAILMTNSVAFSSKLYDMFVTSTPMDIEFNVWTSTNKFETITVPNRAKGNIPASYGEGSPDGNVDASYGSIYIDESDNSVYIKVSIEGPDGWLKLMTEADLTAHDRSPLAHDGILAKIDGAYANGVYSTFKVADPVDDLDAVNKGSLDTLLGGLDSLRTENKENVVSAINEVSESTLYDAGCAVSGITNIYSNYASFISISVNENSQFVMEVTPPFILTAPDGTKHTFTERREANLINSGVVYGRHYCIYIDLDPDPITEVTGNIVIIEGRFRRQARKPYVLAEGDGWLDTGAPPYRFILIERNDDGELVEVEKNYVYIGELEQKRDGE